MTGSVVTEVDTPLSRGENEPTPAPAAPKRAAGRRAPKRVVSKRRRMVSNLILQTLAMVAIGLLVYPDTANWFAQIQQREANVEYIRQVDATSSEERQRILSAAYDYNDVLQPGPLTDPYLSQAEGAALGDDLYLAYEQMLRLSGTDAIGTINYPTVDISVPIYHGTSEAVISKGAGHLYGTSLPIGGPSTRSVLTAHSGLPQAELFTPLHQAKVGDTFWISVLGEDHYYEVRELEAVEPGETDSFEIIENEDWVTLFTCTPIGVNSHRLLVHAIRTDAPTEGAAAAVVDAGAGFPWWAVIFVGGSAVLAGVLFLPGRKKPRSRTRGAGVGEVRSPA